MVGCCCSWVGWSFVGGCGRPWVVVCGHLYVGVVVCVWGVVVCRGSLSSMCGMISWGVRCCPWVAWSSVDRESSSVGAGSSSSMGHGQSWVGRGGSSCTTDSRWLSMWHVIWWWCRLVGATVIAVVAVVVVVVGLGSFVVVVVVVVVVRVVTVL